MVDSKLILWYNRGVEMSNLIRHLCELLTGLSYESVSLFDTLALGFQIPKCVREVHLRSQKWWGVLFAFMVYW